MHTWQAIDPDVGSPEDEDDEALKGTHSSLDTVTTPGDRTGDKEARATFPAGISVLPE